MANKILIKRSLTTSIPTSLANGELAYTSNGGILYIGANGAIDAIGGKRTPGTLTANQAIVVNANGYIDAINTNKLIVGAEGTSVNITSISTQSNNSSIGATLNGANNELATTFAIKGFVSGFVAQAITASGASSTLEGLADVNFSGKSNNDITVYDATSGKWENHSVSGTTNEVTVTFTNQDITIGLPDDVTVTNTITAGGFSGNGANITSVDAATVGGNTATDLRDYAGTQADQAYSNAILYAAGVAGDAYSNAIFDAATDATNKAANAYSNAVSTAATDATDKAANAYSNAVSTAATDATNKAANAYSNAVSYADTKAGDAYTNAVSYASSAAGDAYANATTFAANASNITNGTLDTARLPATANISSAINVGANVNLSTSEIRVGNSSVNTIITGTMVTTPSATIGGNLTVNTDATISGNLTIGTNSSDVVSFRGTVNTDINPAANITYSLGTNNQRWLEIHAANVHSTLGYFEGNVEVGGDLIVTGNVISVDVSSMHVSDPMIYLAGNNYVSDLVDIGFAGNYYDGSTQRHAGVVRHAATDSFYIFKNYTPEPEDNVIDINHASFALADVYAYLNAGGLVANSSAVTITANSSVSVSITANSISLTTPLAATSGGTGQNTYSVGDLLVGGAGNTLAKLTLGVDGKVLQSNGTALVYADLDGGTF